MAYTRDISLTAKGFSYEQFKFELERIEKSFTKEVSKPLSGQALWNTTYPFAQLDFFIETTASD